MYRCARIPTFLSNFFLDFSELINKFIFPTEGASFMQYFLLDQELKSCYAIIDGVNITLSSKDDTAIIPKVSFFYNFTK